uniref:(California timema) hypothetical protein n=1 Tax=Timema californicum TaxID=61474 RepID=A0A7R9JHN5_TIMCA|nr:unnamed protein product [Timema californicum]
MWFGASNMASGIRTENEGEESVGTDTNNEPITPYSGGRNWLHSTNCLVSSRLLHSDYYRNLVTFPDGQFNQMLTELCHHGGTL